MRSTVIIIGIATAPLLLAGCKDVECGEGTIERDGVCQPATIETTGATCGPFTELQVDRCVPQFPPTVCDPMTSIAVTDPATGVTTCVGTGGGGCNASLPCAMPTGFNKLTVCGQLYDFETGLKFQGVDPAGAPCDPASPTTTGPCALSITPYDAIEFATNPATAQPRTVDEVYIDDCGRYRLTNIDSSGLTPFIGLGIDDAGQPNGPDGVTVTTGVAVSKSGKLVEDVEAFIVKASTEQKWEMSGGPPLTGGIYVATYRQHKLAMGVDRHAPQAGVTFSKIDGTTYGAEDYYFVAAETTHETIDGAASVTGMNGTALVTGRSVAEGAMFAGQGGISAGCRWEPHAAATIPGIVFIQVFRKVDEMGMPGSCTE
jgi:hypothetical protein